jgi:hypothetical protein
MTAQGQVDPDGLGNAKMRGSRVGQGLDGHRLQVRAPGMLQDQSAVSPAYTLTSARSCPERRTATRQPRALRRGARRLHPRVDAQYGRELVRLKPPAGAPPCSF